MSVIDTELDLTKIEKKIKLCKPDRTTIGIIKDAYGIEYKENLNQLDSLTFKIPTEVYKENKLIKNPQLPDIRDRFLINFTIDGNTKWFIIRKPQKIMDDTKDYMLVQCFSLAYELADKVIRKYSRVSINASTLLNEIVEQNTNWTIGNIDASFDLMFREFNVSQKSVLEILFSDMVESFNCVVDFDETNRQINLLKSDLVGSYTGLTIRYSKLMKELQHELNTDELCTRLYVFGKDGLSIQRLNPTGQSYIEDFSYFIYPFHRDEFGNITSHSYYLSDGLCNALLDYQALLEQKEGEFEALYNQRTTLEESLDPLIVDLFTLQSELEIILDSLDVANSKGQTSIVNSLLIDKSNKENEILNKQNQINGVNNQIQSVQDDIIVLNNQLKVENNFTVQQIEERNSFIIEKVFENQTYIDDEELYVDAKEHFEKIREPKILFKIGIVGVFDLAEETHNYKKINLGDTINIKHENLNINIKVKILEISYDFESGEINLEVGNVREVLSDQEKFLKEIYQSISTSTTVNMDRFRWDSVDKNKSDIEDVIDVLQGDIKENIELNLKNGLQSIDISRRGIVIKNPDEPNNVLVAQNGVLAISNDSGNTWKTAITSDGVIADRIFGKLGVFAKIDANQIVVNPDDSETTFTAFTKDYTDSRFLNDLRLTSSLPTSISMTSSGIRASTANSTSYAQMDFRGLYIANGAIQIDASNGKTNYITGERIDLGNGGITNEGNLNGSIRLWAGSSYANRTIAPFRVTQSGNLVANNANITGTINATSGTFNGVVNASDFRINGTSILSGGKIQGNYIDNINAGTITAGTLSADLIQGGTISGVTINVSTDAVVGNNIRLGDTLGSGKAIIFSSNASITNPLNSGGLTLSAFGNIELYTSFDVYIGDQNNSGNIVATRGWVQANAIARFG